MTILAVIGLSAAAVLSLDPSRRTEELEARIAALEANIRAKDSSILALEASIRAKDSRIADLEDRLMALQESCDGQIGFKPCWRGNTQQKKYFFTYDVTFANGRYSVSRHREFARGTTVVDELPVETLAVLEDIPKGAMDEAALSGFGRRVMDAIGNIDTYVADCRLAVTINREATGNEIEVIKRARFYPVYR